MRRKTLFAPEPPPKHLSDDPFIELKSVRGNERNICHVRSVSNIPKQGQRVLIAPSADHRRTPKPRPDLDGGEDPCRMLLTLDDRSDLVGLKLRGPEPSCFLIIESTAAVVRFFQPAIDGIPSDAVDSGDSGFVKAFNAESRNLIKGRSAVLKPIVRRPDIGAKRLLARLASVSTALSPPGLIKTKTDDISGGGFFRWRAFRTAETLHGCGTRDAELFPEN